MARAMKLPNMQLLLFGHWSLVSTCPCGCQARFCHIHVFVPHSCVVSPSVMLPQTRRNRYHQVCLLDPLAGVFDAAAAALSLSIRLDHVRLAPPPGACRQRAKDEATVRQSGATLTAAPPPLLLLPGCLLRWAPLPRRLRHAHKGSITFQERCKEGEDCPAKSGHNRRTGVAHMMPQRTAATLPLSHHPSTGDNVKTRLKKRLPNNMLM